MSISKKWLVIGFLYGAAVFLLSPSFTSMVNNHGFWNIKEQLLYFTGSIAMAYMVISMILSVRIGFINNMMGGLDKAYIVHKWVGIFAFAASILHWVVKEAPKVLVALELAPPKIKSGAGTSPITDFQKSLFEFGNEAVEIAFYIMIAVIVISLLKKVPYHIFRLVHKIIPALFLVAAYHSATIQIKGQWFGSLGSYLLWAMIILGSVVAVIELLQFVGKSRKVKAVIDGICYDKNEGIIDMRLSLPEGRFKYQAGQYIFLKFPFFSEPHPFSIASYDKDMKNIRIIIKELGDFTKELPGRIKEGDNVIIEGPYGNFTFDDESHRQIWIAGGIGVTPFMSRLEYLAATSGEKKSIDFFYSARGELPIKPVLEDLCKKAGVNFYYTDTTKCGRLNIDTLKEKAKNMEGSSVWYCGPVRFCDYLKKALRQKSLNMKLHYDNFDMR